MKKAIIILILFLVSVIVAFLYSRPWQNALFIKPLHILETKEKVVALTFDDGPSQARTMALLEILKKHNVKATFFMLGKNIETYPDIAQAVFNERHLIGNHSFDHPNMIFRSPWFITEQIEKTDKLIQSLGQYNVQYFRPPYSSKFIVLPLILQSQNKTLVTGSYDPPSEYSSPLDAKLVADEVIANTKPGSIIYLHDGFEKEGQAFVESVELIIEGLKKKGYSFVSLDYQE